MQIYHFISLDTKPFQVEAECIDDAYVIAKEIIRQRGDNIKEVLTGQINQLKEQLIEAKTISRQNIYIHHQLAITERALEVVRCAIEPFIPRHLDACIDRTGPELKITADTCKCPPRVKHLRSILTNLPHPIIKR